MKKSEVVAVLVELGWTKRRGAGTYIYELAYRFVAVDPRVMPLPDVERLTLTAMVSTWEFSQANEFISRSPEQGGVMAVDFTTNCEIRASELSRSDVSQVSERAKEWAKAEDLPEILDSFARLPTDAVGSAPLKHLVALALLGEISTLEGYEARFANGDRMGFVPYITEEYISRALELARAKLTRT